MNFSSIIDCVQTATDEVARKMVGIVCDFTDNAALNNESVLKLSIALFNFAVLKPASKSNASATAA